MSNKDNETTNKIAEFLKTLGFVRMEDYYDNSGCPMEYDGLISQFFNPATRQGLQITIGDTTSIDNLDTLFTEDFIAQTMEVKR